MKCVSCKKVINSPLYYYASTNNKQAEGTYRCVDCYLADKKPDEATHDKDSKR